MQKDSNMPEEFDIHEERQNSLEKDFENALRPLKFDDFSGQQKVVENLSVFVEAAKFRGEPLDHTLLHGPPGLGKTTLSNIIANELGVGFKLTSGPVLDKPTLRASSPLWSPMMYYSLTRYTAFLQSLRSIFTQRWRTIVST